MQPIGDYLKKLLYQYDCLVVPGLGAFLTHAVSASYNERDGLFLPPRRRLAFNEAMRLDDGILINYLMFHERCNREAALAHIDAFVQEIRQSAHQLGSYTIDGIGLFSLNAENSLQFDPELRHNFLSSAYGLAPVHVQSASVLLAQPVTELVNVFTRNPLLVAQTEQTDDVTIMDMPVRQLSPGWRWAAVAFLAGSLGFISYFTFLHPNQGLQSSLNPASMFRVFTSASMPTWLRNEAANEVKAPAIPVASPAPTESTQLMPPVEEELGTSVATAPMTVVPVTIPVKPTPAPVAAKKVVVVNVKPQPAEKQPIGSMPLEEVAPAAPITVEVSKPVAILPFSGSPYAIVVGSFANRGNALRMRKRLIAAGFTDATLLPMRKGELIKVAALGAASLGEAAISKDSLTRFTGTNALIVRNR
jgi:CCDC81-like prokaryotic HU domain 1/CCDC81-like prokaryotic HU domain 2/SPOR domain